ncbi:maternal effect protein oskar [Anopheles cruzii]|uniref:maternal effect protein oskar n=1 Tax=Anopheles cruzii TaxID=68878 RepID=UPI0022EC2560|nr:maternal effect protein oskar [Anopheles cruzii]
MVLLESLENREEHLVDELRSLIITRSKDGATVDEIIDDYYEINGTHLLNLFHTRSALTRFLVAMVGAWCSMEGSNGVILWYCHTPKTNHIVESIQKQPSPVRAKNYREYMPRSFPDESAPNDSQTGQEPLPKCSEKQVMWRTPVRYNRRRVRRKERRRRSYSAARKFAKKYWSLPTADELDVRKYGPSFHKHQLMGDDFFLSIAKWDLGFSFERGHKIARSGLCISGLTLCEAAKRVKFTKYIAPNVLVNVGTVDLLYGRQMTNLIDDFNSLLARFRERYVEPIITTLAPIANVVGCSLMHERLLKFNEYIRSICPRYIDVWKYFVHPDNSVRFECYQQEPRHMTGSNRPHVLWNLHGRQNLLHELGNAVADQICDDPVQSNV